MKKYITSTLIFLSFGVLATETITLPPASLPFGIEINDSSLEIQCEADDCKLFLDWEIANILPSSGKENDIQFSTSGKVTMQVAGSALANTIQQSLLEKARENEGEIAVNIELTRVFSYADERAIEICYNTRIFVENAEQPFVWHACMKKAASQDEWDEMKAGLKEEFKDSLLIE